MSLRHGVQVALSALLLAPWLPATGADTARNNYMLRCMGCHVADGSGSLGKVPAVRDSLGPLIATPEGRRFLVQVPGAARSPLSDLELAQVLSWMVRNLSQPPPPPGFTDFSAQEVARYRSTPLLNVQATRARLLAAATPRGH
jgi:hypothetical protein